MWHRTQVSRRRWLSSSAARPNSAARIVTISLCLATLAGAAAVAMAAIGQAGVKSARALSNSAERVLPNKSEPVHEAAAGNPLWATPIEVLAATCDRPIFSPTRRPPARPAYTLAAAEPAKARPPAEPDRPPLVLIGTVAGEAKAIAVFLDQKTSRMVRLRSGQSQYGWVLGAVYRREVVLQKDDAVVYLPLSAAPAAPVAAPNQVAESRHERRQR